jgi:methylmalonyl-CoA mutase cobalamin-binding domain/chain
MSTTETAPDQPSRRLKMMTHKQRILKVMRGEMVDRIPFVPRLDLWWLSNATRGSLPKKYEGMMPDDISRAEGWPLYHMVPNFADVSSMNDVLHRAIGLFNFKQSAYGWKFSDNIKVTTETNAQGMQIIEYHTPVGVVRTIGGLTDAGKRSGSSLGWVQEHVIKKVADYKVVGCLFENIEVFTQYDSCREYIDKVGDAGVVAVGGPTLAASPMHMIQKDLIDTTRFFYDYKDHYHEMRELADKIEVYFDKVLDIVADSPAEVVLWGANYDDMITYPPYFEKEISPWLRKVSAALGRKGKILATHTDGENLGLMDAIYHCGANVAESVTPYPMTKVKIDEYYRRWKDKITIMGGIPESMLLEVSIGKDEFEAFLDGCFSDLIPGDRIIFGTADSTPPDASFDRLRRISDRIEKEGRLPLAGKKRRQSIQKSSETLKGPATKKKNEKDLQKSAELNEKAGLNVELLGQIAVKVEEGDTASIKTLVEKCLSQNINPGDILYKGLVAGMEPVGVKFKNNEIFIPEVLLAARAMKVGLELIKPKLAETKTESKGKILIGTVREDMHDIGKNIVAVMFEGAGYEVIDLGIDVSNEKFVEAVRIHSDAKILGLSALLTTTMPFMKEVIDEVREVSKDLKIIVGGAPVSQAYADEIKADAYAADAASSVDIVKRLLN